MKRYIAYLEALMDLSRAAKENLPTYGSWSCFDLGILLVRDALANRTMTIKHVSGSLSCAESNVRRYLKVLEADGWLMIQRNPNDNRSSVVVPSEAMIRAYKQFLLRHATAAQQLICPEDTCGHATPEPDDGGKDIGAAAGLGQPITCTAPAGAPASGARLA